MTFVTPQGVFKKTDHWPRISAGPDFNQVILGSEGNLGVVTEAIIRIRNIPELFEYESIVFPNFELGSKFMEEMAKCKMYPTSLRLVDNVQFQFGQALKPGEPNKVKKTVDYLKKQYVFNFKGLDPNQVVGASCIFEGPTDVCRRQRTEMFEIAARYKGFSGGQENGLKGYQLTYMIAYIRDFCLLNGVVAESFETSCPWS